MLKNNNKKNAQRYSEKNNYDYVDINDTTVHIKTNENIEY